MNIVVDDLQGKGSSKDIVVISQLQILKAGADKIPLALQNLTGRTLKLKKGMNVAHVEASQVIPLLEEPVEERKVCGNWQGEVPTEGKNEKISKILQQLDLTGIESWTEQQQNVVKKLLEEYQHLFALNLKELGKTSLVQHEIKLSDDKPFKERYKRIPPHQYEEVQKHLQEMLAVGAI